MNDYAQGEAPLDTYRIGVIVARFQTPELHEGHIDLIDFVFSRHEKSYHLSRLQPNSGFF